MEHLLGFSADALGCAVAVSREEGPIEHADLACLEMTGCLLAQA
jgi:hypothetical protein